MGEGGLRGGLVEKDEARRKEESDGRGSFGVWGKGGVCGSSFAARALGDLSSVFVVGSWRFACALWAKKWGPLEAGIGIVGRGGVGAAGPRPGVQSVSFDENSK